MLLNPHPAHPHGVLDGSRNCLNQMRHPEMAEVRDGVKSEAHSWPTSQALVLTRDHIILGLGGLLNSLISASVQPLSLFIMLSRLPLTKLRVSPFP